MFSGAALVWLIWYFTTHAKAFKILSLNKATRTIKTISPLGLNTFTVNAGANIFDTTVKKNDKYELLYRSNDSGETVEVVFLRAQGSPPIESATVDMESGKITVAKINVIS